MVEPDRALLERAIRLRSRAGSLLMPKNHRSILVLVACLLCRVDIAQGQGRAPSDYANTLRGSDSTPAYSHGNTFPATTVPFGFNLWTPVTNGNSRSWIYEYSHRTIEGFAASHQPSPWIGDYASFYVMPSVSNGPLTEAKTPLAFEHGDETARPYYYGVSFPDSGIRAEIAPTQHAAIFRFTFPKSVRGRVLFDTDDDGSGSIDASMSDGRISGFVDAQGYRSYFAARIDRRIDEIVDPSNGGLNLAVGFDVGEMEQVHLRIATSFISIDQAKANLAEELADRSFDEVRGEAQAAWDSLLGRIEIEGASDEQRTVFYSCLYRALLYPSSMTEFIADRAKHFSPYVNEIRDGVLYVNNGFWDTYRALWPLLSLLIPSRTGQMLDGFVNAYKEGGWIPRWSGPGYLDMMVGSHSDIVLADAYLKGVRGFDIAAGYESMLKNALVYSDQGALGRKGNARSIFRGYIPLEDIGESAAWFLEDQVNDFGIAQVAEAIGDSVYSEYFWRRAHAYANLFSASQRFFRGKRSDGSFRTSDADFHPNEWGYEFTEGAAWHYVAAANHDPFGMSELYGGADKFADRLEDVLAAPRDFMQGSYADIIHEMKEAYDTDMGQYAHPNEPVHHMLYMFDYAGKPWLTQQHVRRVLQKGIYTSGLGDGRGYLGDEDNGQMSAWYVFSALGLYPASPGHAEYAIGSPLYGSATLHLENGNTFSIVAHDNAPDRPYIQSALLNGDPLESSLVSHETLLAGGRLELQMGPDPSRWAEGLTHARPEVTGTQSGDIRPPHDCAQAGHPSSNGLDEQSHAGLAFDDDSGTSWRVQSQTATLSYEFPSACALGLYTVTSTGAAAANDPESWVLQGSNDGRAWTTLDERSGETFRWRRQTRVFPIRAQGNYNQIRLIVEANHGGEAVELAELELLDKQVRPDAKQSEQGMADTGTPVDASHQPSVGSAVDSEQAGAAASDAKDTAVGSESDTSRHDTSMGDHHKETSASSGNQSRMNASRPAGSSPSCTALDRHHRGHTWIFAVTLVLGCIERRIGRPRRRRAFCSAHPHAIGR